MWQRFNEEAELHSSMLSFGQISVELYAQGHKLAAVRDRSA